MSDWAPDDHVGEESSRVPRRWVEVFPTANGEFAWRVKSANGQIVSTAGETLRDQRYTELIAKQLHPNLEVRIVDG